MQNEQTYGVLTGVYPAGTPFCIWFYAVCAFLHSLLFLFFNKSVHKRVANLSIITRSFGCCLCEAFNTVISCF